MKKLITHNFIIETKVRPVDFNIADEILGRASEEISGKLTAPSQSKDISSQVLLHDINININKCIKLYVVTMYICGCLFLYTKSKDINYIMINYLPDRKFSTISKKLNVVIKKYVSRGFTITDVFGDNEFASEKYTTLFLPATVHICSKGEHVPIIERSVRTVKDRARSATVGLAFETVPQVMVVSLLEGVERWLNAFLTGAIDQEGLSHAMIVEGMQNPRYNVSRIAYGTYALVYIGTTNTLDSRAVPAFALRESNNNGGHYFMSLKTDKRIHSNKWVEMSTTELQVNRVHELADIEGCDYWLGRINVDDYTQSASPTIHTTSYSISDSENNNSANIDKQAINLTVQHAYHNLESDESTSEEDSDDVSSKLYSDLKDSTYIDHDSEYTPSISTDINSNNFSFNIQNAYGLDTVGNDETDEQILDNTSTNDFERDPSDSSNISNIDVPLIELTNNEESVSSSASSSNIEDPVKDHIQCFQVSKCYEKAVHVMFAQMFAHKGIKLFGERAIAAMMKELKQLNNGVIPGNPVIEPIPFEELSHKDKEEALEAVNIITQECTGKIKERMCANGSRQRKYLKDGENFASPTASLESIMATLVINAHEGRDIVIADVQGAYLHTKFPSDKNVILRMRDIFVDIMCKINEEYKDHVIYEINKQGKKIKCLYVKVLSALYGCLESGLL